MNLDEFLSSIKNKGALIWGPSNTRTIEFANSNLQQKKCAMLPNQIISLYMQTAGINLGTGYMFGPSELPNGANFPIPSIVQINEEIRNIPTLKNKTVFARNDLFWFAFDSFGTYYMLNNINGNTLRTYDNAYRALYDCLMGGKL
ncbi:MAG: SMI1/KNR4 family protein [Proteobacteria bacterium]|nr:SMI1/KNR4 family protein [Candidatus Enterousia onthequi]MCQ2580657.1 hypothetical protein [Alphaproteobacteria bacterium]